MVFLYCLLSYYFITLLSAFSSPTHSISISQDQFVEDVIITPLPDGKVSVHFKFDIYTSTDYGSMENNKVMDYRFFPQTIGEIIQSVNVQEFRLSFTQGRWDPEVWGYPTTATLSPSGVELMALFNSSSNVNRRWKMLTNIMAGSFCASLDEMNKAVTAAPVLSFRRGGVQEDLSSRLRYAHLAQEAVCTENLTPWLKLLPCQSKYGLAGLLNSYKLFDSHFYSMSTHLSPICKEENECNGYGHKLSQNILVVLNPLKNSKKRDWNIGELFGKPMPSLCPIAAHSNVVIKLPPGWNSNVGQITPANFSLVKSPSEEGSVAIFQWMNKQFDINQITMTWKEEEFNYDYKIVVPDFLVSRYGIGYGQENGGFRVTLINNHPSKVSRVVYFDKLPWFLRVYLHTLQTKVESLSDGKPVSPTKDVIENIYYQTAIDRERPYVLEILMNLPPNSKTTFTFDFDKTFMRYSEYPPDANKGFEIGSACITLLGVYEISLDSLLPFQLKERKDTQLQYERRIYTQPLSVSLPVPDFSMPYNVITLSSTAIVILFGSIFNLAFRPLKVIQVKDL